MARYAQGSTVSPERTKAEIERTLTRFGASDYMCGHSQGKGFVAFVYEKMPVRILVSLPERDRFKFTPQQRYRRDEKNTTKAWEQACREHWRGLLLLIKAKLVAIENGHSTFEREFLADMMLPNGGTVEQWMAPQIEAMLETGAMPQALLPGVVEPLHERNQS